jgi:hypothetical protein
VLDEQHQHAGRAGARAQRVDALDQRGRLPHRLLTFAQGLLHIDHDRAVVMAGRLRAEQAGIIADPSAACRGPLSTAVPTAMRRADRLFHIVQLIRGAA